MNARGGGALLALSALGVVFGDIGTSPLYAMGVAFDPDPKAKIHLAVSAINVFGLVSLIFWSVTIVVTLKYVVLITRADNDGEGGIMALIALIRDRVALPGRRSVVLVLLGLCGAALFYGDSVLTPAISVLSAVEGLKSIDDGIGQGVIVGLTAGILVGLFAAQRFGTDRVGRLFGPVMLVWFLVLGALGLKQIAPHPELLRGLSPTYAIDFISVSPGVAFLALSAVVLTITGGEALYADMGHFGRPAIMRAWLVITFPCLVLNYLGQAQVVLANPADAETLRAPLFSMVGGAWSVPFVVLATFATVIASQAVISGAFSLTRQASLLGFLPRVRIINTSHHAGQVYVPLVNWLLLGAVLTLVFVFRSSTRLADAYGIAVIACTAIDTILFFFVVRFLWRRSKLVTVAGFAAFIAVDLMFLASCMTKFLSGGYVPVGIGAAILLMLTTWQRGRVLLTQRRSEIEGSLGDLVEQINSARPPLPRIDGTAVFLHAGEGTAPLALRANLAHNRILHDEVVILRIEIEQVPHIAPDERLRIDDLGHADDGIMHVTGRFGFQDTPNIPALLAEAQASGSLETKLDIEDASYFLSRMEVRRTNAAGMSRWRKRLFQVMMRASTDPVVFFGLPYGRTVILGQHVDL